MKQTNKQKIKYIPLSWVIFFMFFCLDKNDMDSSGMEEMCVTLGTVGVAGIVAVWLYLCFYIASWTQCLFGGMIAVLGGCLILNLLVLLFAHDSRFVVHGENRYSFMLKMNAWIIGIVTVYGLFAFLGFLINTVWWNLFDTDQTTVWTRLWHADLSFIQYAPGMALLFNMELMFLVGASHIFMTCCCKKQRYYYDSFSSEEEENQQSHYVHVIPPTVSLAV
jgi:hypothetical protein